jgi:hypothetical protein
MFLAAIIFCTGFTAETCFPVVNAGTIFYSFDECYADADMAARYVIEQGGAMYASPYCFPLNFGEPV